VNNKTYNEWITRYPKITLQGVQFPKILQDVLVTIENIKPVRLTYVDYEVGRNGDHKIINNLYGLKRVIAYMLIPTIDISAEGWHGDYTDEEQPSRDDRYLVCIEISQYNKTYYKLAEDYWRRDKFICNRNVIGWREFPKSFEEV